MLRLQKRALFFVSSADKRRPCMKQLCRGSRYELGLHFTDIAALCVKCVYDICLGSVDKLAAYRKFIVPTNRRTASATSCGLVSIAKWSPNWRRTVLSG